jgi:hypothetical protein
MLTFVFVALGIQHAVGMRHIVLCGLSGSSIFFHIISRLKKIEHELCALIFFVTFV